MDREELFEIWQRNKDRPQFVREYREELQEHTTDGVEWPAPDASTFEYRQFLNRSKGTVTRQLGETTTGEESDA
ncbi:hypothetical protein OSG_eHP27_00030 [environmental Halophage eHP-27]|nr:hypothetical protein OSG_eHP27_00030 [environmental Halophage eHP-27]